MILRTLLSLMLLGMPSYAGVFSTETDALVEKALPAFKEDIKALSDAYGVHAIKYHNGPQESLLEIYTQDQTKVFLHAEIIGVFDMKNRVFTWGWADSNLPEKYTKIAQLIRQHGKQNEITELTTPTLQVGRVGIATGLASLASLFGDLDGFTSIKKDNSYIYIGLPSLTEEAGS